MTDPRSADVPWLTPYLIVRDARVSIGFYEKARGFVVRDSVNDDGSVIHVEMTYRGQLILMFAPEGAYGSQAAGAHAEERRHDGAAVVLSLR